MGKGAVIQVKNVLLAGPKGIGKTTIIKKSIRRLGDRAGGFFCEDVMEGKRLQGVKVHTLTGSEAVLASPGLIAGLAEGNCRIGEFGVDLAVLGGLLVPAVEEALGSKKVVIIDEISPFMTAAPAMVAAIEAALSSENPVLGTITEDEGAVLEAIKNRTDTLVLTVTRANRETLLDRIFTGLVLPTESFAETERNIAKKREKAERYAKENRLSVMSLSGRFKSDHHHYDVTFEGGQWHCGCSFFLKYGACSHSMAAAKIIQERVHGTQ